MTSFIIYSIINTERGKEKQKRFHFQLLPKKFQKGIDKLRCICYNKDTKGKDKPKGALKHEKDLLRYGRHCG